MAGFSVALEMENRFRSILRRRKQERDDGSGIANESGDISEGQDLPYICCAIPWTNPTACKLSCKTRTGVLSQSLMRRGV